MKLFICARAAVIFALESTKGDVTRLFNDFQYHIAPRIQAGTIEHAHTKVDLISAIRPSFSAMRSNCAVTPAKAAATDSSHS